MTRAKKQRCICLYLSAGICGVAAGGLAQNKTTLRSKSMCTLVYISCLHQALYKTAQLLLL